MKFSHLHVHTQFSLLDGAANISSLYKKAAADNMPALAITDHGNMFGVFKFVAEANKHLNPDGIPKVKPIVGCEFYVVEDRHKKTFTKDAKDVRYHQLMLAKNEEGYKNLVKLCSLGYIEGVYGKYPRIDKELIEQHHSGLIATTCCLAAEVPRTILRKGEEEGEKVFNWWLNLFGEDYYIELQRHGIPEQNKVNEVLLRFAKKYNVKAICSNDSHYVNVEDYNAHDILLCINTGEKQSTPSNKEFTDDDSVSMRGKRFAFFNDQFYFKTTAEMEKIFSDVPLVLDNTNHIVDKIKPLRLKQDIMLPHFKVPEGFATQDDYLKHLSFEGAKKRYGEIPPELEERLNFELFTIRTMGFAGYFLIVADFINHGREIGVLIGPGRGSAAGSAVAYCIGITNIDPIKYNLLFERFLNPDRKSMPDIDTDFDDEGRQKVIDYVVQQYGKNQVAQIVTYGSMAAKMSIKDVARVMDLPLPDSLNLTKLVPERPGIELGFILKAPLDGDKSLKSIGLNNDEVEDIKKLRDLYKGDDLQAQVLKEAVVLEGSVRGTGIHAAGVIIAPKDLTEIIPVATSKDTDLLITQYDGKVIEDAGVIKMDFLGLKTLTIIRDALQLIKENHNIAIDIDTIPLDDPKTFELFQKGATVGIFQFEAEHVPPILRNMKPTAFEDLIALNALNRPGPLAYIPNYINRKHGREKINYDLPVMEEILKETYGITVYQEQVMLLSQKLAGFSKGDADVLRKAMGKKQKEVLDKMKSKFMEGATKNGHPMPALEKIWTDWEKFAEYAFNKAHSTCYAFVAFQTAYLKAHYPAEFMASVLTHHLGNIDKITFFMEESRRMGMPVLGPDVNESEYHFSVNEKGEIRFGLGAIKGVGEAAVRTIIDERRQYGRFTDIFDLVKRVNLRAANKKTFESLTYAGALDSLGLHRGQYLYKDRDEIVFLERLLKFGQHSQTIKVSSHVSLFGDVEELQIPVPPIPDCEPMSRLELLKLEREVIGFYISGHPLDSYKLEIKNFCNTTLAEVKNNMKKMTGRELAFAGMVLSGDHRISKTGRPFGIFTLEDYSDQMELALFGEDYVKKDYKNFMNPGYFLFVKGRIQERYMRPDELEFKVTQIQLLTELRDKLANFLHITIPLGEVKEYTIARLQKAFEASPGKVLVKVDVFDEEEQYSVKLFSRKYKVRITDALVSELERMGVKLKITQ